MFGAMVAAAMGMRNKLQVQITTTTVTGQEVQPASGYAGIKFFADGTCYSTPGGGSSSYSAQRDDWLVTGSASNVWIQCDITGGTLASFDSEDAGQGTRLSLASVDRAWRLVHDNLPAETTIATFTMYDAASGGNQLASQSITFSASSSA